MSRPGTHSFSPFLLHSLVLLQPNFLTFAIMKNIAIIIALAVSSVSAIQINFVNNCGEREVALVLFTR
jgi:hypothetical protein